MSTTLKHDLIRFLGELEELRLGKKGGHVRPHKLIMLLAVANLIEKGQITNNRIYFNSDLKNEFARLFAEFGFADDLCQPSQPFFHLRSANFWQHKVLEGKEHSYAEISTSGGGEKRIHDHIDYAYLEDFAYKVFTDRVCRVKVSYYIEGTLKAHHLT